MALVVEIDTGAGKLVSYDVHLESRDGDAQIDVVESA